MKLLRLLACITLFLTLCWLISETLASFLFGN